MPDSLLAADEPAPVTVHNENGSSPFLIVSDHAGNSMPRSLGRLGGAGVANADVAEYFKLDALSA